MQNHKIKIQKNGKKQDLTIIYKESEDNIHEMKAFKDSIFESLRYFQRKSNEINPTNLIFIEENIPFDLFKSFILSTSSDEIDINDSNYEKIYYLSCKYEYQELKDEIEKFINTRPDIQNVISQIINANDDSEKVDSIKEELISKNLDISIKTGLLNQIPLNSLVRILNSPKRVIKDHHLLFTFVVSMIKKYSSNEKMDENVQQNLSLLIAALDYCSMRSEEIEELLSIDKIDLTFSPRNAEKRIQMFIEEEKEMKNKISLFEEKITQNEENYNKIIKNIEENCYKKINDLENKITQNEENYKKKIKDLENKITQNEENHNQRINNIDENYKKKIKLLKTKKVTTKE